MRQRQSLGTVALECIFDLGITVVYAVIVGFLIVGIVATDEGPVSILRTSLCAVALPGAALLLIAVEITLRLLKEARAGRLQPVAIPSRPIDRQASVEAIGFR